MMMKKSKALVGACVVLVCAILVSPLLTAAFVKGNPVPVEALVINSPEPTPTKHYEKVAGTWTFDCEFPVQRPEIIMLTCADGGMIVSDIKWETWSSNGATGKGIYSQNMCDPNCAEGTRMDVPVGIKLNELIEYKGRNVLKALDIKAVSGRELPNGNTEFYWDVSEFAFQMSWDNSLK